MTPSAHSALIGQSGILRQSRPDARLGLEFEPGVQHGEDGQDRRGEAARPHESRPGGIELQLVQWDEKVTQVLERVQQERGVAAEDGSEQTQLLLEPGRNDGRAGGRSGGG